MSVGNINFVKEHALLSDIKIGKSYFKKCSKTING